MEPTTKPAQTCSDAVWNDPAHHALMESCGEKNRKAHRLEGDLLQELRKVQALMLAYDSCLRRFYNETTESEDETLEAVTGEDGECWACNWQTAGSAILSAAVSNCRQVLEIAEQIADLNNSAKADQEAREELAVQIRRKWHEAQRAVEKAAAES